MTKESEPSVRNPARQPIELEVEYKRLNALFSDYCSNISNGGTFIETDDPLSIGTEFVFKLRIPSLEEPLRIRSKVEWVSEASDQEQGMGIRFLYSQESERKTIESAIEGLMVSSLGGRLTAQLLAYGPQLLVLAEKSVEAQDAGHRLAALSTAEER